MGGARGGGDKGVSTGASRGNMCLWETRGEGWAVGGQGQTVGVQRQTLGSWRREVGGRKRRHEQTKDRTEASPSGRTRKWRPMRPRLGRQSIFFRDVHLYELLMPLDWCGLKVLIVCHGGAEVPAQAW